MGGDGDVQERALFGGASWLELLRNFDDVLLEAVKVEEWLGVGFWMDV